MLKDNNGERKLGNKYIKIKCIWLLKGKKQNLDTNIDDDPILDL